MEGADRGIRGRSRRRHAPARPAPTSLGERRGSPRKASRVGGRGRAPRALGTCPAAGRPASRAHERTKGVTWSGDAPARALARTGRPLRGPGGHQATAVVHGVPVERDAGPRQVAFTQRPRSIERRRPSHISNAPVGSRTELWYRNLSQLQVELPLGSTCTALESSRAVSSSRSSNEFTIWCLRNRNRPPSAASRTAVSPTTNRRVSVRRATS